MKFPLLAALLAAVATPTAAQTVVVVRHAEKGDQSADPDLSNAGRERAEALAAVPALQSLDHVFVSPLRRTGQTAGPAAAAARVMPVVVPFDNGTEAQVAETARAVRALSPDSIVLVVGHSNTVPLIARALGQAAPDMPDCEYDRLTVIRLQDPGSSEQARYGRPSACE